MAGLVLVGGVVSDKAGTPVPLDAEVALKQRPRYVSRAGEKLAHALLCFAIEVAGVSALDVGASTGGFVDCLLQGGAKRVIALDVGRGQLDARVASDPRVTVIDRLNARYLTQAQLPYRPDFLTMDVSFISVTKVLPSVVACMAEKFEAVILVKPQFEAGPALVGKGGIVRDSRVHREVILERARFMANDLGLEVAGACASGLRGTDGNQEFFLYVGRCGVIGLGLDRLEAMVDEILTGEGPVVLGANS